MCIKPCTQATLLNVPQVETITEKKVLRLEVFVKDRKQFVFTKISSKIKFSISCINHYFILILLSKIPSNARTL